MTNYAQPAAPLPRPRNTLVLVRERKPRRTTVGKIEVPGMSGPNYMTAEVLAIGPGLAENAKGETETFDLKVGQRVWIHAYSMRGPGQRQMNGEMFTHETGTLHLFEQSSIMLVLNEPGDWDPNDIIEDDEAVTEGDDEVAANKRAILEG